MKKKLLATLFMVCFIFVFAPKTVHAYSYYWYVNPIDTLYSDIAEKKNFYLAGKESKYAYYCHNMDEIAIRDGSISTHTSRVGCDAIYSILQSQHPHISRDGLIIHLELY